MLAVFLFYILLIPLEYLQEKIPKGPTGVNYGNVMMLVLLMWWWLARTAKGRSPLLRSPLNVLLAAYVLYHFAGLVLASLTFPQIASPFDPGGWTFKNYLRFFNCFLIFWVSAALLDTRRKMVWAVWAIALAVPLVFRVFYGQLQSVSTWHYSDDMRIGGPMVWVGSNELAAFFTYNTLFLGLFAFIQRRWWQKGWFLLTSSLYAYGVLYCYSRAAQLSFGVGVLVTILLKYRSLMILVLLAAATSKMWMPASVIDRWEMTTNEEGELDASAQSREDFWGLALQYYLEQPVTGHGVGSFRVMNPAHMDTHNIYMRILSEQGTIGFVLFLSIWGVILWIGVHLWRKGTDPFDQQIAFACIIATLSLMVGNLFGDRFTHLPVIGQYWVLIGILTRLYANNMGWEPLADAPPGELEMASKTGDEKQVGEGNKGEGAPPPAQPMIPEPYLVRQPQPQTSLVNDAPAPMLLTRSAQPPEDQPDVMPLGQTVSLIRSQSNELTTERPLNPQPQTRRPSSPPALNLVCSPDQS